MVDQTLLGEFSRFAASVEIEGLKVHRVAVALDERQDGEPVTRAVLLVEDPDGETWDIEAVRELKQLLARKATELELPSISVTLVPRSEAGTVETFAS